ncbi:MAG: ABC transporter ATP-binding protein [Chloroflexi bacterium]|nr:ABC transporter ATP-binding protein [Chloroflexota bacterium]MDA8189060.1 ABC transporter ATP-binding protein [Dehalococcoidales bacterium]
MLRLDKVSAYYGRIQALREVSLEVRDGEVVTIIGANGAGKTTLLNTISGVLRAREGRMAFDGKDIVGQSPKNIVGMGIVQVPEGRQVFPTMTVKENLEMGAYSRRNKASKKELLAECEWIFGLFPVLPQRLSQKAGSLSGGEQQMLAIGRALLAKPRLLLLDEPSMGLAPKVIEAIFAVLGDLNRAGLTILLVEQNASVALSVAHRGYVLSNGRIILEDACDNLIKNEEVRRIYFGKHTRERRGIVPSPSPLPEN